MRATQAGRRPSFVMLGMPASLFVCRLALLLGTGCWLLLLATALAGLLRPRFSPRPFLLVPSTLAALAALSYLLFWVYFGAPRLASAGVLGLGLGSIVWCCTPAGRTSRALWREEAWWVPLLTTGALGVLYFALLHLWPHAGDWNWLAARRFKDELPVDNLLPQLLAERLRLGAPLEPFIGDWLSSDRPPLAAAWLLLAGPLEWLGGPAVVDAAAQALGLWHQLLWWPVALAVLRHLGLSWRGAVWTAAPLALTPFLFTYSVYVWPKLSAGAFGLLAWLEWRTVPAPAAAGARPDPWAATPGSAGRAGLALGLALLSHGGAAFPLLAGLPWLAHWWWRHPSAGPARNAPRRRATRAVLALGAASLLLLAPWLAYQHWGAPPGNRLLKWHLAGAPAIDDRSTSRALYDAFAHTTLPHWWQGRMENLRLLGAGDWRALLTRPTDADNLNHRRADDFFLLLRSLGWWNLGLLLLPAALKGRGRPAARPPDRTQSAPPASRPCRPAAVAPPGSPPAPEVISLLGWAMLTLALWILLMFAPASTVLHQGASLPPLVLLLLSAWALGRLHPGLLTLVALTSLAYTTDHYILHPPRDFTLAPSTPAAVLAASAAFVLLCAPRPVKALADCT